MGKEDGMMDMFLFGSKVFSLYNTKYSLWVLKFSHYFLNIVKNIGLSLTCRPDTFFFLSNFV